MLSIPSYTQFWIAWIFLPLGAIALYFAVREIFNGFRSLHDSGLTTLERAPESEERSGMSIALQTLAGIVFTVAGFSMFTCGNAAIYEFRNIDVATVTGLRVYRKPTDSRHSPFPAVDYRNAAVVQDGLRKLEGCTSQSVDHEHFVDGYNLQLIFEDPSIDTHSISVFVRSSASPSKTAVIPKLKGSGLNLGAYLCPSFQDWVAENIDPLFDDKPQRQEQSNSNR